MCTLSWWRGDGGLEVFFNRDEQKSRSVAEAPRIYEADGGRFLAPIDPDGGGTWMLANEFGVVVCLLNRWDLDEKVQGKRKSRGQLVLGLGDVSSVSEVSERLERLESYPGFTLIVFDGEGQRCWEWDGVDLVEGEVGEVVTSSSFQFERVREARLKVYGGGKRGEAFHASVGEEFSAFSVRMNRPDAQTWSRSRVRVGGGEVVWEYLSEVRDLEGEGKRQVSSLELK